MVGVCVSCASSVACRHACVGGRMCAVVLTAQLGPYAVCVCRVRRLLPVGMRAWAGVCVPSCSVLIWARMRCVCVVCVVCCLSACVRGRAYVCRRAHCSAGPVCGVCVSCASSVACQHACVGGHACAVVLGAQLGPYAVCVCRVRRLLPVGVRAWAGVCVPSCSVLSWARMRCVCVVCVVCCLSACVRGRAYVCRRVRRLLPVGVRAWAGVCVPSCSLLSWARMRCVCVVCVVCCLSACVRGRAYVCRRAHCSAGPVCGVCVSCASSVACRRACVGGRMCAVVLTAQLGPYAVCVRRVRRLLPVGVRAWAGMRVPSCSLLSWARMRCVCVVCVVCCLSACVRGRAYVCRRAHCSAGPVCGVCVSCASSVACRHACVGGRMCAVVLGAQLGPYAVCVRCVRRLLPVGVRAWAGMRVPSCSVLIWARMRCVCVGCVVCCLSACVRGRAYVCRRAHCSAGPVCGVCALCASSVACQRACVGGRMCAVVLGAQLGPYAVCVCRVRRLLPVGVRAWAGMRVPSCSVLIWARMRCVCVGCVVCCLSACVRGRAYVCRRAHCSAGPVCGVCVSCASSVACRRACVGGRMCAVVLTAQLDPYAVCVCRVRRLLPVGMRAWAGVCVASCSLLSWARMRCVCVVCVVCCLSACVRGRAYVCRRAHCSAGPVCGVCVSGASSVACQRACVGGRMCAVVLTAQLGPYAVCVRCVRRLLPVSVRAWAGMRVPSCSLLIWARMRCVCVVCVVCCLSACVRGRACVCRRAHCSAGPVCGVCASCASSVACQHACVGGRMCAVMLAAHLGPYAVCVRRVRRLLPVGMRAWAGVCVPSCSVLSWARMRCVCVVCVVCCLSACVRGRACVCRRARCSAGPVCGVCASCASSVACQRACVGGRMCGVVLAAHLGPYAVCVRCVRRLLPVGMRAWAGVCVPSCSLLSWARMRCVCVVCVVCCLSACVRGRAYVCRRAHCSAGPVCGVCVSGASSVACQRACVGGRMCAVVLGAHLGPYAVCVCRVRRLLPVGVRAWAGMRVPSCSVLIWARMRCVCVGCVVCCLSACVRGRAYVCRRAHCSAGPVCGVCALCASSVACQRACVGGRMCAVVLGAQLGPYAVCVCRVRRLLPVGVRAWAGMRVPSCSVLTWARMRCVCVGCVVCCLSACVRGRAYVCRRAHCSAGPVCGVCVSCASSVACRRACVGGRMCAVVLTAQLGPYAVCVRRVRRLLPVSVRAWAGMRVPSCSVLSWARMRCVCVVCVVCCLSACVRGRACVCRRARCSAGPVCGVCVSCASSVACQHACVGGRMCAVVLTAQLGPYAVCVRRVRRLLPVSMRAWAGMRVPSCSLLSCWSLCRRGAFGVVLNCIMKGNEMLLLYIIYYYLLFLLYTSVAY